MTTEQDKWVQALFPYIMACHGHEFLPVHYDSKKVQQTSNQFTNIFQ